MLVHLTPIAVLACCVLAAALNTSTLKPDLGNIFAVYPGWTMSNPNDAVRDRYRIFNLCVDSLSGCIQATPRGISELACQQTCSAGGCISDGVKHHSTCSSRRHLSGVHLLSIRRPKRSHSALYIEELYYTQLCCRARHRYECWAHRRLWNVSGLSSPLLFPKTDSLVHFSLSFSPSKSMPSRRVPVLPVSA
jgi:hypothetical protein